MFKGKKINADKKSLVNFLRKQYIGQEKRGAKFLLYTSRLISCLPLKLNRRAFCREKARRIEKESKKAMMKESSPEVAKGMQDVDGV